MTRSGRRPPWWRRSPGARRRRCAGGCIRPSATAGLVRGSRARSAAGSRSWRVRTVGCAERTSSFARHRRICLPSADNNTTIRPGGAQAPGELMVSFIDEYRGRYGVGPVPAFAGMTCAEMPRAPVHSERPDERVNRDFQVSRPNALWVSDPRFHHSGAGPDPRFHGAGSMWRRGGGSPARPSSSTPVRGASWAGGSRIHCTRTWPSMPSNKPFTSAVRAVKGSSIAASGACSPSRCVTPSASCR